MIEKCGEVYWLAFLRMWYRLCLYGYIVQQASSPSHENISLQMFLFHNFCEDKN